MKNFVKKSATIIFGWTLIVFGAIGLFLPILQGILMIAIGLVLVARHSERMYALLERLTVRYPKLQMAVNKFNKPKKS